MTQLGECTTPRTYRAGTFARKAAMAALAALSVGAPVLVTTGASASAQPVTLTEVCVGGGPSNHVWADESFSGLDPAAGYHLHLARPADNPVSWGGELGWLPNADGTHVARIQVELLGSDPIARAGQTYHWKLEQSVPSSAPITVAEGDTTVLSGSCVSTGPDTTIPDTTVTSVRIRPARHKATFAFSGLGTTSGFQCMLKKAHHTASYTACSSPKAYRHLSQGRYKVFVRAIGPGGTDATPAAYRFRI